ncbi:MAG: PQQ-dependent sugar dehydrogenase [Planctomycetaceae bacterium]|nr:PQQ-dependent sugar dehydrogenase [Planctomycetaceae bacterium]
MIRHAAAALALAVAFVAPTYAQDVDRSPLAGVVLVRAFPKLKPRRPVHLTHAGDGTNRVFIVSEHGQLLVIPNDPMATELGTFLDIEPQVDYQDTENEEGLLGLAFHPKYKENGQFFVHYTAKQPPHTTVVSRFRVSKGDPNKADPKSEEVLFTYTHPYWNHKGGNLVFGPDGFLYIGLGDGGDRNDPHGNGQNLKTPLGKILRIDIDQKANGKPYAVPADNPFVSTRGAVGEIYAYGLRNPWGMAFDPVTKLFWVADVGQNIWEEIVLVEKGGNYGWNVREGFHKFDVNNANPGPGRTPAEQNKLEGPDDAKFIEPIWEYHHDTDGKSITGGTVYRGTKAPALAGYYLYADYVTGKIWGLKYDEKAKRVVANRQIAGPAEFPNPPVMAIGTDERGEIYLCDSFGNLWTAQAAK